MTKEERQRALLKGLVAAFVLGAIYMFALRPLSQRIRDDQARIDAVADRIHRADRLMRGEPQIRADAEAVRASLRERLDLHLPPAGNTLLWATQTAYRHGTAQDVEIRAISEETAAVPVWVRPADSEPSRPARTSTEERESEAATAWRVLSPLSVKITVEASFPQLVLMMASLEDEHPLLNISVLSIQYNARQPEIQTADITLQWPRMAHPLDPAIESFLNAPPKEDARP